MLSGEFTESVRHLPDQLRDIAVAAADLDGLPAVDGVTSVVILGTGGARVGGDALEAICELTAQVPIVATGARCPAWVSASTLAIAVSRSGNDGGVVEAADAARLAGAPVIAITSGGALGDAAHSWGVPVVPVDPAAGPAVGLGASIVPVLVLLERLGFVSGMTRTVSEAADRLGQRIEGLLIDETVRQLAEVLPGRVALVTAAGSIGKHAARRWVQELDRFGGVSAVRRRLPMGQTDVETGRRLHSSTANGAVLVMLRHADEPPGLDGGVALARDRFEHVFEIQAQGEGPLAQLLDLVLVGDAVAAQLIEDAEVAG
ncbi:MAG: SIS domain-containing protein [Acidimicrobiales bacterium]|nr:SIS domain-containing protein [Acidimicrobiales bacterium]